MRTKNMTRKEFALQILQQTYPFDDRETLDQYINGRYWNDQKTLIRMIEFEFGSCANEIATGEVDSSFVENIAYGMNYYIRGYQAIPAFKQKIWNQFYEWLLCIGKKYNISKIEDIADTVLEKPVDEDLAVAVVKALHVGASKTEMADMYCVSEKTIQNTLHLLDPTLDQDAGSGKMKEKRKTPRFGGQLLQVDIKSENVEELKADNSKKVGKKYRKYSTEETLHPVALQMNVTQVGIFLKGMQLAFDTEVSYHSLNMAINVWSQLSEYCKSRLKEWYHPEDIDFHGFLQTVEEAENAKPFITEVEMFDDESVDNQLNLAFKGSRRCNIKLDGKVYRDCRIHFDINRHNYIIKHGDDEYEIENVDDIEEMLLFKD